MSSTRTDPPWMLAAIGAAALLAAAAIQQRAAAQPMERACPGPAASPAPPPTGSFQNIPYATWSNAEPAYLLYPGDELELVLPMAMELNRVITVRPDGRITLPAIGEVMAAGRDICEVRAEATERYAREFRRPIVELSVKAAPMMVYVEGEVGQPSRIDLIGDVDALQAITQAGGFKIGANQREVIIVRRAPGGRLMMRTANLARARRHGDQPDLVPLARGDVVIVPRTGLANTGAYVQQVLAALPFTFSWNINGNSN